MATDPKPYECAWCLQRWSNRWSAATCCDEVSNSLDDEWKGYD